MENTKQNQKESKLTLLNKKNLTITGIEKVIAINETNVGALVNGEELVITGKNIEVNRLDVDGGILDLNGEFESFKYTHKKPKENFLKKIFK